MLELVEFFRVHIHREDAGFVVRESGEVERFAAGTGTGVDDALAGLGVEERRDGLRGGILDLDAAVEAQGFGQHFPGRQGKRMRVAGQRSGLNAVLGKPDDGIRNGGEEGVDAEENRWLFVEGGELGFPEIAEFGVAELVEPIGDRLADGAWLLGEFLAAG